MAVLCVGARWLRLSIPISALTRLRRALHAACTRHWESTAFYKSWAQCQALTPLSEPCCTLQHVAPPPRAHPALGFRRAHPAASLPCQASFHLFGMELLATLDLASTNAFFNTFFRLPGDYWRGFLASKLSSADLILFALAVFTLAPWSIKYKLVEHLVTGGCGGGTTFRMASSGMADEHFCVCSALPGRACIERMHSRTV